MGCSVLCALIARSEFGPLDATTVKRICGDADNIQKIDAYERWEYDFKDPRGVTGVAHLHFQKGHLTDILFNTK